jgi:hypothetical protein
MNSIKVMPDYECHALWHYDSEKVGDVDPHSLGVSDELASDIDSWAVEYDTTLNQDNPAESGFPSKDEEVKFVTMGYELALRLKQELKGVSVIYYDIDQQLERKI